LKSLKVLILAGVASILAALLIACGSSSPAIQKPTLSITTSSLASAEVGVAYNAQLAATGGAPPYTWSLASGNMPPGLILASNGAISGTATAAGAFNFPVTVTDSLAAHQTVSYNMAVMIATDAYGGFPQISIPGCTPTGYFQAPQAIPGGHWVWPDPLCNAYQPRSVQLITYSNYASGVYSARYGSNAAAWAAHTAQRLHNYGFNRAGDYSTSDYPDNVASSYKQAFSILIRPVADAVYHPGNCNMNGHTYTTHINDFQDAGSLSSAVYSSWSYHESCSTGGGPSGCGIPDVYSAMVKDCMDYEVSMNAGSARSSYTGGFATSAWVTDISLEDMDFAFPLRGVGADGYPHAGFLTAVVNPTDPVTGIANATKAAWITYLQSKYMTIANLNAAWGTSYVQFASTGSWGGASPATNVADEDGRNLCTDALLWSGCPSGFVTDANQMLYLYTKQLVTTMKTELRTYDTNHPVSALNFLGGAGAVSDDVRIPVLNGLKDSGVDFVHAIFVGTAARLAGATAMFQKIYNTVGKPILPWYELCGNPDAAVNGCDISGDPTTQAARATQYDMDWGHMFAIQGSDSTYPVLGVDWWGWSDGTGANWGISTPGDNLYNGTCAVIATSTDPWGETCGGESANYGDFLDGAVSTHIYYGQALINASGGGSSGGN
jgi:putative Ig domain-containing protein